MHVDGAFGAMAALAPNAIDRVSGMARADSLAFDLHKWLYVPFDAACVLVRDAAAHRRAFSPQASYLAHETRGTGSGVHWFNELGMELSRGFRALKVWMSIKEHGVARYGEQIAQNIAQAGYLAELVTSSRELELCAPVPLNIVCFRVRSKTESPAELNALNRELLVRLQERGIAVPSSTMLEGRYVIRVAITNHRSRREDFDLLVRAVVELAGEVRRETGARS
ncbi:MAG: pyridoxal-dependent decarboxylase, partial [Gemmatimonadota bacterium]|nr:pyridoxal-dependent decarboxylase [Gemmatimonadota bacterium]